MLLYIAGTLKDASACTYGIEPLSWLRQTECVRLIWLVISYKRWLEDKQRSLCIWFGRMQRKA